MEAVTGFGGRRHTHNNSVGRGRGGGSCFRPGSPGPIFPTPLSGGKLGNITAGETDGRTRGRGGSEGEGTLLLPFHGFFPGQRKEAKERARGVGEAAAKGRREEGRMAAGIFMRTGGAPRLVRFVE